MFGLSATSQEMLSTAHGSRINPIKRYRCCVTSYSKTPPPWFVTIGARDQDLTNERGFGNLSVGTMSRDQRGRRSGPTE